MAIPIRFTGNQKKESQPMFGTGAIGGEGMQEVTKTDTKNTIPSTATSLKSIVFILVSFSVVLILS